MVKHLEKGEDLESIIKTGTYLVDFYADWCGPCKMLAPLLEEIDFISVVKVNVDLHQELAQKYGIMSIPTLMFFKDGVEKKKEIGFRSVEDIKKITQEL